MKSQASIEFLMLAIMIAFFILVIYTATLNKTSESILANKQQKIKITCESISSAINDAFYFGNGFSRNVTMFGNYTIKIYNSTVICYSGKFYYINSVFPPDIRNSTGATEFEVHTIPKMNLRIENNDGTIVIK